MTTKTLTRIYHPYWKWEEVIYNMWGVVTDKRNNEKKCLELMQDLEKWSSYMERVTKEWTFSCEHNLTDNNINRMAWLGQAACALAMEIPADIVRTSGS